MSFKKEGMVFFYVFFVMLFSVLVESAVCINTSRSCGCGGIQTRYTLPDDTCSEWTPCSVSDLESACLNGADDNCDGNIDCADSDCSNYPSCVDADADGFKEDVDCDDTKASRFPGNIEVCDSLDNDCDGLVDEALSRQCGASNVGVCRFGDQVCSDGVWGSCVGLIGPTTEACNLVDDNCDGVVDEGCECQSGQSRACGIDTGICEKGTQSCVAGTWGDCDGSIGPYVEVCGNSLDDDCDADADEGCAVEIKTPEVSAPVEGEVSVPSLVSEQPALGEQSQEPVVSCIDLDGDGFGAACAKGLDCVDADPSINPSAKESCNNKDDDCDGGVDDALFLPCGFNRGICTTGMQACQGGVWSSCSGVGPKAEVCGNSLDDDCDGVVDTGCSLKEKVLGSSDAGLKSALDADLGKSYDFERYKGYVKDSARFINVKKSSEVRGGKTFVTLELVPVTPLFNVTVYEEIPKSLVDSADKVRFRTAPRIVRKDPLVAWHFAEVKDRVDLSYELEGEHEDAAKKTVTTSFAESVGGSGDSVFMTFLPLAIIPLLGLAAVVVIGLHKKR
jgi:hypothetical protein